MKTNVIDTYEHKTFRDWLEFKCCDPEFLIDTIGPEQWGWSQDGELLAVATHKRWSIISDRYEVKVTEHEDAQAARKATDDVWVVGEHETFINMHEGHVYDGESRKHLTVDSMSDYDNEAAWLVHVAQMLEERSEREGFYPSNVVVDYHGNAIGFLRPDGSVEAIGRALQ